MYQPCSPSRWYLTESTGLCALRPASPYARATRRCEREGVGRTEGQCGGWEGGVGWGEWVRRALHAQKGREGQTPHTRRRIDFAVCHALLAHKAEPWGGGEVGGEVAVALGKRHNNSTREKKSLVLVAVFPPNTQEKRDARDPHRGGWVCVGCWSPFVLHSRGLRRRRKCQRLFTPFALRPPLHRGQRGGGGCSVGGLGERGRERGTGKGHSKRGGG